MNESFFAIQLWYYQLYFRESTQVRAYTLDDLVGMLGGYLGLFMGYALVQLPSLISLLINLITRMNDAKARNITCLKENGPGVDSKGTNVSSWDNTSEEVQNVEICDTLEGNEQIFAKDLVVIETSSDDESNE